MDDDYDDFFNRQDISEGKDDDEDKDIPSVSLSFCLLIRGAFKKKMGKVGLLDQPADPPTSRRLTQKKNRICLFKFFKKMYYF